MAIYNNDRDPNEEMWENEVRKIEPTQKFELVNWEDIRENPEDNNQGYIYGINYLGKEDEVIGVEWFETAEERNKEAMKLSNKAVIVSFFTSTRIIVDADASEEQIIQMARKKISQDLDGYLCSDNIENIEDDSECPFGTFDTDYSANEDLTIRAFGMLEFSVLEKIFGVKLFGLEVEDTEAMLESLRYEWCQMDKDERAKICDENLHEGWWSTLLSH